jgi:hypothetical protein
LANIGIPHDGYSNRTEAARKKSGILIPAEPWSELEGIAQANAVAIPLQNT